MSLDSLFLTIVAILVIFFGIRQLILSRNLCIYNLVMAGLVITYIVVIIYQHFDFVFIFFIQSNEAVQRAFTQDPKFIMKFITSMSLFFGSIAAPLSLRIAWLSSKLERFVQRHLYHKAVEIAEQRLKLFYRFYGNHYLTGSVVAGLASLYESLGRREDVKRLFLEAIDVFSKSFFLNSQNKFALEVRIKLSLRLSEFLLEEDFVKAEAYCQEVLNLEGNKRVSGIFLAQARQLMALIQSYKGSYNSFVAESAKAKGVYQNWVESEQRFQRIRDKLKSANDLFVTLTPTLITVVVLLPPIFFPFFRTQRYMIFFIIIFASSQFIDFLLSQFIKQNSEKQEAIVKYCSLIEQEGNFYEGLGDYELAEEKYNEVLYRLSTIHENSVSKELVRAQNWLNRASLNATRGLLELTSFDKRQADYENAISNYDEALRIYESINNYSRSSLIPVQYRNQHITCLLERYVTYARLVGIEVAEDEVFKAFTNAEKLLVYPSNYSNYASALINLGFIYHWAGSYSKAEEQYFKAEQILVQYLGVGFYEKSYLDFAKTFLFVATGRLREALESLRQSNETANVLLLQRLSVASEKHRMYALQSSQVYFNTYATLVCKFFSNSPSEVGALFDLALRRKAIGSEVLATQRDVFLEDRYPPQKLKELKLKLENLTKKRREIAHKMLEGIAPSDVAVLQKLNRERETLEEELAREIPELNLEKKLKVVNRQMVSQALPSGSVLIEIVLVNFIDFNASTARVQIENSDSAHYLAFVLHAGQPDNFQLVDLGSAETIDRLLARFRAKVTREFHDTSVNKLEDRHFLTPYLGKTSAKESQPTDIGVALRAQLFDPLVLAFGERKKLFISPDGNLTQIPFEILPTDDGRRLIDLYSISYLSTGRDVLRFNFNSAIQSTAAIVIADPDFNYALNSTSTSSSSTTEFSTRKSRNLDLRKVNFERLPGMREEGEIIANLLGARRWLGDRALKEQLFKSVHSPLILHIVTHGFFLPNQKQDFKHGQLLDNTSQLLSSRLENPLLRSCLALAGANWKSKGFTPHPDAGNGILTAEEVSSLNLSATELVVLSACETGRGETLVGEGVFGLRRAFVLAGAKTLIMSLWQVPDEQTKELMVAFYNRLLNGESRSEALRNSQLEIRKKNPNPYFWGAFICQGYPGTIPTIN